MARTNRYDQIIALIDACLAEYEVATRPAATRTRRPPTDGGLR